ncbi:MAG: hypothetical protein ACKVJQ_04175 [Alphaproteobacteria bacterium]
MILTPPAPTILETAPLIPQTTSVDGATVTMRILIPNYRENIEAHYGASAMGAGITCPFEHFGILVSFDHEVELAAYNPDWVLHDTIKDMIARFGVVLFKHAHLSSEERTQGQKNIFPSLAFHYDRPPDSNNVYSFFFRNPFDPIHKAPRTSTTLLCANAVCYAQSLREGTRAHSPTKAHYDLFANEAVEPLIDDVMVEEKWCAPEGSGEICVFDNRTILHASYYRDPLNKGYPIGVRYLF